MLKIRINRTCLVFLIFIVLSKTSYFIDSNILSGKIYPVGKPSSSCTIQADNIDYSIEIVQQSKRIWGDIGGFLPSIIPFIKCVNVKTVFLLSLILLIIDLREYILRLITVYFHGSKYKDGGLLSAF